MADIERWITVNGVHIPIMKGESKMAAVGRFIKEKIHTKRTILNDRKNTIAEKLNRAYSGDGDPSERKDLEYDYKEVQNKLSKLNERRKIKGITKTYEGKYKLKADNYKLSKAESKLQDFAQVSKSEYNISNIKAKELPSGAIHITTKSGKDISTISPKALTAAEKNDLRRKGILK